jgi:hypothetical protein
VIKELLVPAALTEDGFIIRPSEGRPKEWYKCLECSGQLFWRKYVTVQRRSHFVHQVETTCSGGAGLTGQIARKLVEKDIQQWIEGRALPTLVFLCSDCGHACPPMPLTDMGPVDWVRKRRSASPPDEQSILSGEGTPTSTDDEARFEPDITVGGESSEGPACGAIEIRTTEPISEEKIEHYTRNKMWWVEIHAEDVLLDPPRWRVLRSNVPPRHCWRCTNKLWREANDLSKENIELSRRLAHLETSLLRKDEALLKREGVLAQEIKGFEAKTKQFEERKLRLAEQIAELEAQVNALAKIQLNPEETLAHAKLVEMRKLEATYKEIFDVTERLRCKLERIRQELIRRGFNPDDPTPTMIAAIPPAKKADADLSS